MPVNYEELKKERAQEWREELRKSMNAKERSNIERVVMPENPPMERNKNFFEVNQGLSKEQAMKEASRCLDCPTPTCISGCPVNINIPGFIKYIEKGDFLKSAEVLKRTNALPAICLQATRDLEGLAITTQEILGSSQPLVQMSQLHSTSMAPVLMSCIT